MQKTPDTLLFMPTSPVHVTGLVQLRRHLKSWQIVCILIRPHAHWTQGIIERCRTSGIDCIEIDSPDDLDERLREPPTVVGIGAVFETRSIALFAWAKQRSFPVVAIEEVAQLGLNDNEIDNYDMPFDRLFVANRAEAELFVAFGHDKESIHISGLLADDENARARLGRDKAKRALGISTDNKVILYTTSCLRWRLMLHSKDDWNFRQAVLHELSRVANGNGITIIIKLHPNEDREHESRKIHEILPGAVVLGAETDIQDVLAAADVVVNRGNSQTTLQAARLGVPLVILACGLKTVFHRYGGARIVEHLENLREQIVESLNGCSIPTDALLTALHYQPPQGAGRIIARELEALSGISAPPRRETWEWVLRTALFHRPHDTAKRVCQIARQSSSLIEAVHCALVAEDSDRMDLALDSWLRCAELDPTWFFPNFAACRILQKKGDIAGTTCHFKLAVSKLPHNPLNHEIPLHLTLVRLHRQRGDFQAMQSHLQPLLDKGLDDVLPEITLERAFLAFCSGDLDACRRDAMMALDTLHRYPLTREEDAHLIAGAQDLLDNLAGNGLESKPIHADPSFCHSSNLARRFAATYLEASPALPGATILIAARNAAPTIGRAVRSARAQGDYPIILIDDYSTDETIAIARSEAPNLTVLRPPYHGTLGFTRQFGIDHVQTPYALWLDADDEFLPGRVIRLLRIMHVHQADLAFDELELVDGITGSFQKSLPIPSLLRRPPFLFRLFERNYLPGVGQVAFRTEAARAVGYDPELHGPEDIDFVLRALVAGFRFRLVCRAGYRMHTYGSSVSRQIINQRAMYRKALFKHSYSDVRRNLEKAGSSSAITAWALASLAIFREEYQTALAFVDEAAGCRLTPDIVIEPDGPCPLPEGWRLAYHRGTLHLLLGNARAARQQLEQAERLLSTPEGANNLGVALAKTGDILGARECFILALEERPDYLDAHLNLDAVKPQHVTSHPLRRQPARSDYSPEAASMNYAIA